AGRRPVRATCTTGAVSATRTPGPAVTRPGGRPTGAAELVGCALVTVRSAAAMRRVVRPRATPALRLGAARATRPTGATNSPSTANAACTSNATDSADSANATD